MAKVLISVNLEADQARDLKALAESTRVPMASMIREAVQAYLDARRSEIPPPIDPRQMEIPGA